MLSLAQTSRSRVISYHLQDLGGYRSTVGYICYRGTEPWGDVNRGWAVSMHRLTHVIPSMPVKDHIIVGASDKIERVSLTQLAG